LLLDVTSKAVTVATGTGTNDVERAAITAGGDSTTLVVHGTMILDSTISTTTSIHDVLQVDNNGKVPPSTMQSFWMSQSSSSCSPQEYVNAVTTGGSAVDTHGAILESTTTTTGTNIVDEGAEVLQAAVVN
jgi:hypothetical protein